MATPGRRQWGGAHLDAHWAAVCNRGAVCGRGAEARLHTVERQVAAGSKYLNLTALHHAQSSLLACGGAPARALCGRQTKPKSKPKSCTEDMLLGKIGSRQIMHRKLMKTCGSCRRRPRRRPSAQQAGRLPARAQRPPYRCRTPVPDTTCLHENMQARQCVRMH